MTLRSLPQAVSRTASVFGAQSVPLGGVLAADWTPATGLALFWIESVALAFAAAGLAALLHWDARRRASRPGAAEHARHEHAAPRRLDEVVRAHIRPKDILAFHVVSYVAFGIFLSGVLYMISQNTGGVHVNLDALLWGGAAVVGFVIVGAIVDAVDFRTLPTATVVARVDACSGRWAMFWVLGFFGPILIAVFGKPLLIFALFGGLKALWEIARLVPRQPGAQPAWHRSMRS